MTRNTILRYFERVNEHSILWPRTPHKPTLPLLLLLLSKENSLRNGLFTYRFWVKCFFGLEELKNNKHFFPISSNCWPSAEPLLPSANPQPMITVDVCSLYVICSWCYLMAFLEPKKMLYKHKQLPEKWPIENICGECWQPSKEKLLFHILHIWIHLLEPISTFHCCCKQAANRSGSWAW